MHIIKWNGGNIFEQLDTVESVMYSDVEPKDYGPLMGVLNLSVRVMPRIQCRKYEWSLSIQGGYHSYCYPKNLLKFVEYEEVEIAIAYKDNIFGELNMADLIEDKELLDLVLEYKEGPIYPHIPVALVQRLVEHIC